MAALLILQACGSSGAAPEEAPEEPEPAAPIQVESNLPSDGVGEAGEEYSFTFVYNSNEAQANSVRAQAAGEKVVFRWSWGDGQGSHDVAIIDKDGYAYMEVAYTYNVEGPYAISVTVEERTGGGEPGAVLAEMSYIVQIGEVLETEYQILQCTGEETERFRGERGVHHHEWDLSEVPTGATIDMWYDTVGQPDKYIIEYPSGWVVHDTGWRGDAHWGTGEKKKLYPGGIAGGRFGTVENLITKQAGQNTMEITIIGPDQGTVWYYTLTCHQ